MDVDNSMDEFHEEVRVDKQVDLKNHTDPAL